VLVAFPGRAGVSAAARAAIGAASGAPRRRALRLSWAILLCLLVGLVALRSTAAAQDLPPSIFQHKLEVRLVGYLDARTETVRPWRQLVVRLVGTPGEERQFALTDVIVISGDASGIGLIEGLLPTRPNLFVAGDKEVIHDIAASTPDQRLKITGFIASGSRWFLVYRFEREDGSVETDR